MNADRLSFHRDASRPITTDLLTPLGAYLRLREAGQRELPARVGRAGPARPPLVHRRRLAARLVRGGGGARPAGRRLPRLRPRREARADGAAPRGRPRPPREPLRRRATPSSASTTAAARPRCSRATPRRSRGRLGGGLVLQQHKLARAPDQAGRAAALRHESRVPCRPSTRTASGGCKELHPRRRRLPDRALAAGGAADGRVGARPLPRAPARQPVAVPLPARARRPRARRLLARDARQVRGRPREPQPDRRHDASPARATPSGCSPPRRTAPST